MIKTRTKDYSLPDWAATRQHRQGIAQSYASDDDPQLAAIRGQELAQEDLKLDPAKTRDLPGWLSSCTLAYTLDSGWLKWRQ